MRGVNIRDLKRVEVAVPPLHEQLQIAAYIAESTRGPVVAGGKALREIDLLLEFRTRLIADVVTGKLDVREAAAALGEIGGEAEEVEEGAGVEEEGSGDYEGEGEGVEGEYAEGEDEGLMEVAEGSV